MRMGFWNRDNVRSQISSSKFMLDFKEVYQPKVIDSIAYWKPWQWMKFTWTNVTKNKSNHFPLNKAGYTAQDAPSTRLKITRDRRTYGPTDGPTDLRTYGPTDGRTDTPSYRDATAHLKIEKCEKEKRKCAGSRSRSDMGDKESETCKQRRFWGRGEISGEIDLAA